MEDSSMMRSIEALYFKRLDERAVLPTRGSERAAGLDIYSIEDLRIAPKSRAVARTGLAVAIPAGFYGRLAPRSGLAAKHGLDLLAGVIDSDYRGEINCILYNTGDEPILINRGSRICQLIIEKIISPEPQWADDLEKTARDAGGFGSTGS
jgi:dUTP pyrophosphatase